MAHDPLMSPEDPDWWATVAEEAESLTVAIHAGDVKRRDRKAHELRHALNLLEEPEDDMRIYLAGGSNWTDDE